MTGNEQPTRRRQADSRAERVLVTLAYVSFLGGLLLVVNIAASFEGGMAQCSSCPHCLSWCLRLRSALARSQRDQGPLLPLPTPRRQQ